VALLHRLNQAWASAAQEVPHWKQLVADGVCPQAFGSWEEYRAKMPIMAKKEITGDAECYYSGRVGPKTYWSKTGGTIAAPLRFPVGKDEMSRIIKNEWLIRRWVGISPFTRQFKIWGHSHIFAGAHSAKIWRTRRLKDALLGMVRLSAYDLSEDKLAEMAKELQTTSCGFVMSYSRCLETVADWLLAHDITVSKAIRAVIATSECFTNEAAEKRVAEAFGAPVFMEYGSAETGPIAMRDKDGIYRVAWRDFWLEALPTEEGHYRLLITSLRRRLMPLFRYEIGDLLLAPDREYGVRSFGALQGRVNEMLVLKNGRKIHSEAITHAIGGLPGLGQFQFVVTNDGGVTLRVLGEFSSDQVEQKIQWMRANLGRLDATLAESKIVINQGLLVTAAGKRPLIYRTRNQ